MGVARPPGFLGVAQDPPLRLPAAPSRALCPPPRTGRGSPWEAPLFLDAALRGSQAGRFLRQPEDEPPSPPGSSAFLPGCRSGRAHGSGRAAPLVPAPAPAPAREVGWLRATPAEVGLSLGLAGFFPPHLLPPHPAYTHSQSQGEDMPTGRGPRGDQRCPRSPSS